METFQFDHAVQYSNTVIQQWVFGLVGMHAACYVTGPISNSARLLFGGSGALMEKRTNYCCHCPAADKGLPVHVIDFDGNFRFPYDLRSDLFILGSIYVISPTKSFLASLP